MRLAPATSPLFVFILTMAGVSEVSETTGIKTRQTCSARKYERGKRKRESQRCSERERKRIRGGERTRENNEERELKRERCHQKESIVMYVLFVRIREFLRDCRN